MSDFTASNGVTVSIDGDHLILPPITTGLGPLTQQALREFFQKENDDRLGRWRWPEDPDYVVYPIVTGLVAVVEEKNGTTGTFSRSEHTNSGHGDAARAYFLAHPDPKPWHDAKPGEVWEIEVDGRTHHARVGYGDFAHLFEFNEDASMTKRHSAITAGRRIWPEVAS
ncbi:hypothetical protein IC744_06920 [Microbacterium hominis]|uniref:hypothetical protein n=1 Tax=Microbacterium hominis TaxID=162426 RepID=UPI00168AFE3A|nr:hypothetical protein [Microbacterium hominis]QOC26079.1 hypothetical protein IC745_01240 [Microbacterium hominis]QOC30050.1 hypothetical protein IC744_06920 [Microbacterium hominis]